MELFEPLGGRTVHLVKAMLTVAGIACALLLYLAKKHKLTQVRKGTVIGLFFLATLSLLAYHNLGRFHRKSAINIYDSYHYYMGSKYFHELGYWYLYEATLVAADEELMPRIVKVGRYREQKTYARMRKHIAHETKDQWRARFTPERWDAFKRDLRYFAPRMSQRGWRNMLNDKGYNPTPVWTMLGGTLAHWVPARPGLGIFVLTYLDLVFILAIIAALWYAFGVETALLSCLFLGINYTTPFGPIGGAFLRWDYCMWLIFGLCALKKNRPFLAGLFLAYAAILRISPVLLMAGPALLGLFALIQWLWQQRGATDGLLTGWRRGWKESLHLRPTILLGSGFLSGGLVLFLLSLIIVDGGVEAWSQWRTKMEIHQHSLGTKRYGLKYLFVWTGEVEREDLRLDEGGWDAYDTRKQERLGDFGFWRWLVKLLFLAGFAWAAHRLQLWEAAALGVLLIFILLSPTRYYYAQLIVLVPLLVHDWPNRGRLLGFCLLMGAMLLAFFFSSFQGELVFMQWVVSLSLLFVFIYLLALFIREPKTLLESDAHG